jgi:hypothetical protein
MEKSGYIYFLLQGALHNFDVWNWQRQDTWRKGKDDSSSPDLDFSNG